MLTCITLVVLCVSVRVGGVRGEGGLPFLSSDEHWLICHVRQALKGLAWKSTGCLLWPGPEEVWLSYGWRPPPRGPAVPTRWSDVPGVLGMENLS